MPPKSAATGVEGSATVPQTALAFLQGALTTGQFTPDWNKFKEEYPNKNPGRDFITHLKKLGLTYKDGSFSKIDDAPAATAVKKAAAPKKAAEPKKAAAPKKGPAPKKAAASKKITKPEPASKKRKKTEESEESGEDMGDEGTENDLADDASDNDGGDGSDGSDSEAKSD